jgi:hypothetical protein
MRMRRGDVVDSLFAAVLLALTPILAPPRLLYRACQRLRLSLLPPPALVRGSPPGEGITDVVERLRPVVDPPDDMRVMSTVGAISGRVAASIDRSRGSALKTGRPLRIRRQQRRGSQDIVRIRW